MGTGTVDGAFPRLWQMTNLTLLSIDDCGLRGELTRPWKPGKPGVLGSVGQCRADGHSGGGAGTAGEPDFAELLLLWGAGRASCFNWPADTLGGADLHPQRTGNPSAPDWGLHRAEEAVVERLQVADAPTAVTLALRRPLFYRPLGHASIAVAAAGSRWPN